MTNLPVFYPFSASCRLRPKNDFFNDSQVFYIDDHVTIVPIHPVTATYKKKKKKKKRLSPM